MSRRLLMFLGTAVLVTLLISACGTSQQSQQEKIAVVDYAKVVKVHPDQSRLEKREAILEDLLQRRKQQERVALAQLKSLQKLRELTAASQRSYLSADFNTRMVEMQAIENDKMQRIAAKVEAEADQLIADRKNAVEEAYRLELFNLRVQLESVKLKPELRDQIQLKLVKVKEARERELAALMAEKNAYMEAALKPYIDAMNKRLSDYAAEQESVIDSKLSDSKASQEEKLKEAPGALHKALSIMDKEIAKQQAEKDELKNKIDKDIVSISSKLAHERGYTIVFKEVKVNVQAADITDDVIKQLQTTQNASK